MKAFCTVYMTSITLNLTSQTKAMTWIDHGHHLQGSTCLRCNVPLFCFQNYVNNADPDLSKRNEKNSCLIETLLRCSSNVLFSPLCKTPQCLVFSPNNTDLNCVGSGKSLLSLKSSLLVK